MIHRIAISVYSFLLLANFVTADEVKVTGTVTKIDPTTKSVFLKVTEDGAKGSVYYQSILVNKAEILGQGAKKLDTVPDTWATKAAEIEVTVNRERKKATVTKIECLKFTK